MNQVILEERVGRLERENRRLKLAMLAVVAVVAALVCVAAMQPAAKVVRAERFEVADSTGKTRAEFEVAKDGCPNLALLDKSGKAQAVLALDESGAAAFRLCGRGGDVGVSMLFDDFGTPLLKLSDLGEMATLTSNALGLSRRGADSTRASTITIMAHLSAMNLSLWGEHGSVQADSSSLKGGPCLTLLDKEKRTRAALALHADGRPRLELRDSDAKMRALLCLADDRSAMLSLYDKREHPRAVLAAGEDENPVLGLTDKDGNSLWEAPSNFDESE